MNTISKLWKNTIYFLSGLFIGASAFLLVQANYTVQTNIQNAVQVIKKIVIEKMDGTTWSILSWNTINTVNMQANLYCDENGTNCKDIADVITWVVDSFSIYSGNYYNSWIIDTKLDDITGYVNDNFLTWESWTKSASNIFFTGGNVWIWTETPYSTLDIKWTNNTDILVVHWDSSTDKILTVAWDPNNYDSIIKLWDIDDVWWWNKLFIYDDKTIFSNWNVGIGADTPQTKFEVRVNYGYNSLKPWILLFNQSDWDALMKFKTEIEWLTNIWLLFENTETDITGAILYNNNRFTINTDLTSQTDLIITETWLNINGMIKIWSGSSSVNCSSADAWEIKFSWSNFYGCNWSNRIQF